MGKMYEFIEADQALDVESIRADLADRPDLQTLIADLSAQNNELLQEVQRLEVLCDHDAALHILNRRGLSHALEGAIALADRHAVVSSFIYLDLDGFKPINDQFGHGQGDHILKELADHIKSRLRKTDHFARLGGDEFAIILAHATPDQALGKIQDLSRSVAKDSQNWGPGAESLTFSAGVSEIVAGQSASEIIRIADENMYLNKALKA